MCWDILKSAFLHDNLFADTRIEIPIILIFHTRQWGDKLFGTFIHNIFIHWNFETILDSIIHELKNWLANLRICSRTTACTNLNKVAIQIIPWVIIYLHTRKVWKIDKWLLTINASCLFCDLDKTQLYWRHVAKKIIMISIHSTTCNTSSVEHQQ